jgi:GNAT superfamily N-acetyltransferase
MQPPHDLTLRDATGDDLPAIAALREAVGWTVHEWALRAVIGVQHARCFVAVDGRALAGVGSGIAYGPMGFVGNMVVAETHRRRGIGSAILQATTDYLEAAGCLRLELNATSEGRPLYERHGFASMGFSATARIPRDVDLAPDAAIAIRRASPEDLGPLAAYDRPRFGGDRMPVLALLLDDPAAPLFLAARESELVGYACVRTDAPRIGPLLADDPTVAETLMVEAFAVADAAGELRLNLPPNNHPGTAWLHGLGVQVEPWDGRMARGPQIPRRDDTVYGMAVGALG